MTSDIQQFLSDTPWRDATIESFDADWSVRSYARVTNDNGGTAILLQSPPDDSPDAMVGHLVGEWSGMNAYFKSLNLNVPTIIKQDLSAAYILMDDFGNGTIADKGVDAYLKATDILIQMRDADVSHLKKYEDSHVYKALRFFSEYVCNGDEQEWFQTWHDIENALALSPRALTHMDFAPQNLMWNNAEIGIIDFQAACDGPFVYDLVNLLEDIRIDVPNDTKQTCKDHYCASMTSQDKAIFDQWYVVITAQFHARILGQIQYLAQEKSRDDLMQYYDPLMKRFEQEIKNDLLKPVKEFIDNQ